MNDPESKMQLDEIFAGLTWALKYAFAVGFAVLLVLSDRQDVPGRMVDEIIWRPDRAIMWGLVVLIVLGGGRALVLWGNRAENGSVAQIG